MGFLASLLPLFSFDITILQLDYLLILLLLTHLDSNVLQVRWEKRQSPSLEILSRIFPHSRVNCSRGLFISVLPNYTQVQQFLGRCQNVNSYKEDFTFRIEQEPPCQVDTNTVAKPGSLHCPCYFNLGESFFC